ncbi:MAG: ATP-grasp domain-containing protein, partial [Bryobacteraceae bacterium]
MLRIAFVTCRELPGITADDQLAAAQISIRGHGVEPAVWDDPAVPWSDFALLVLRSCWDYHLHAAEFLAWIAMLARNQVRLWNPPPLVLWNAEKTYLRDLAGRGVQIVPTVFLAREEAADLRGTLNREEWERAVVKPAISASAHETFVVAQQEAASSQEELNRLLRTGGVLIQKFMPEISSAGEWSLMFFNGAFSHAVLKKPKSGDFRTQSELGATAKRCEPPAGLVSQAEATLAAAGTSSLYARVDGIYLDDRFQLLELELIEPEL